MTNLQPDVSDSIVRKIQLLLNLAARAEGNEAEAAAAMAKAQDMLAQYNLDLAVVQDAVVAGGVNMTKEEVRREKIEAKRNATYEWTRRLVKGVAEANYCVYFCSDSYVAPKSETARGRWASCSTRASWGRSPSSACRIAGRRGMKASTMRTAWPSSRRA